MIDFLKKILGYSIIFIHCITIPISIYIIIFVNNFYLNYLILLYFTLIVLQWIIFGNCLLSPIENYLLGEENKNKKSPITIYFEKYVSTSLIELYLTYLPFVIILSILIKLFYQKYML